MPIHSALANVNPSVTFRSDPITSPSALPIQIVERVYFPIPFTLSLPVQTFVLWCVAFFSLGILSTSLNILEIVRPISTASFFHITPCPGRHPYVPIVRLALVGINLKTVRGYYFETRTFAFCFLIAYR